MRQIKVLCTSLYIVRGMIQVLRIDRFLSLAKLLYLFLETVTESAELIVSRLWRENVEIQPRLTLNRCLLSLDT